MTLDDERQTAIDARGISKAFGANAVLDQVDLVVTPGDTVALLGPSGCGKTTLLRTIAGLERPDAGTVSIDGQLVVGPRTHVPPERRRIGMVFQDWALFPHLSVGANVGYGLSREDRRGGRVEESLRLVGLGGFADRMPSTLSGGQQQRVALARALAPRPKAILLDEPFSNLDTALRVQVRTEVHALLTQLGITTVFVTHDQEEAFVLGDQVAVMSGGRIEQQAPPAELYDHPASAWVARFVGDANLLVADADGSVAATRIGPVALRSAASGPVEVLLRPEQVLVHAGQVEDLGGAAATVELVEFYGHDSVTIVRLDDGTELRARTAGAPHVRRGDRVRVGAAPGATVVGFDQRTTDSPTSAVSSSA
ncbi:ATP-binding cassette domain-containing protein [Actinomarinicola tropica]|uniref:ABC-type quaternary amine transporter n=1 Tax=Actinomarinicola tropica TaxID=2789776 RepID=A0A5Q2RS83_9ACTN|nr:ATP-binding cassette domain-containing protein [Actinomarinicola tropica]